MVFWFCRRCGMIGVAPINKRPLSETVYVKHDRVNPTCDRGFLEFLAKPHGLGKDPQILFMPHPEFAK